MKTISQRELRNDNAEVMREVAAGRSFTVTHRGTPLATLSPITSDPLQELTLHPGTGDMAFPVGIVIETSALDALEELRGTR